MLLSFASSFGPRRVHRAATLAAAALLLSACGDDPQVPTTATPLASATTTAVVATSVTTIPSVKVLDAKGRAIKNVMVRWRVTAGGGRVVNDSVRTTPAGDASSGGWTLGTTSGTQTLQATADGISAPVIFTAEAAPGPASRVVLVSGNTQEGMVNSVLPNPPTARVEDQFGNPVPSVPVSFSAGEGGVLEGAQQVTNAQGVAAATAWRLGTTSGIQSVRATVANVGQAVFSAVAFPGPPADLVKAGGDNQQGINGAAITAPPGVRVVDAFNNPVGNVPVSFTPGSNSGTVSGGVALTDPATGVAFVGSWILGDQPQQTLIAASSLVPGKTVTFSATATISNFKIDIRFIGAGGTARQREAFVKAAAKWRRVVVGRVHEGRVIAPVGACLPWTPAIDEVVTDVIVYARIDSIDGPSRVLARAGPCVMNIASRLTMVGIMEFDRDDMPALLSSGTIDDVVLHEMGHVLGVGTLWDYRRTLLVGAGTSDPFFTGVGARAEFPGIGGAIYSGNPVPVENTGGAGTRDGHWRNSIFGRELMQGFAAAGGMPLSRVTAASLADLGYTINLSATDPFRLAGSLRSGFDVLIPLDNDIADMPLYEARTDGTTVLRRAAKGTGR